VTRIGLTFLGAASFCLLSLVSPDSALLGGGEKINVPFAGPVSFFGFTLLAPTVLIVLRGYLQIYVEHSERLDRLARSASVARVPTLVPLQNPLIRLFSGLIFYTLLPLAISLFAWKAGFPGVGIWSVRRCGSDHRLPCHVTARRILLAIKGIAVRKRGDNYRMHNVWLRASAS
jgi:hypothetical protein